MKAFLPIHPSTWQMLQLKGSWPNHYSQWAVCGTIIKLALLNVCQQQVNSEMRMWSLHHLFSFCITVESSHSPSHIPNVLWLRIKNPHPSAEIMWYTWEFSQLLLVLSNQKRETSIGVFFKQNLLFKNWSESPNAHSPPLLIISFRIDFIAT